MARLPEFRSISLFCIRSCYLTPTGASALFSCFTVCSISPECWWSAVSFRRVLAATEALLRFGSADGFLLEAAWPLVRLRQDLLLCFAPTRLAMRLGVNVVTDHAPYLEVKAVEADFSFCDRNGITRVAKRSLTLLLWSPSYCSY